MIGWHWCAWPLLIFAAVVGTGAAAHADPAAQVERKVRDYTPIASPALCHALDDYPTVSGVLGVMQGVIEEAGVTDYQASQVVTLSVATVCPRHIALLEWITAVYSPETVQAT